MTKPPDSLDDILRKFTMHLSIATGYLQEALDRRAGKREVRGNDGVLLETKDSAVTAVKAKRRKR